jgi:drug/metabolite transporter (DMT)-like permease
MGKNRKKRWKDMSPAQRAATVVGSIVQVSLLAAALWDIAHRPEAEIKGSKGMWRAASFVNFVGPIAYFLFGRKKTAAQA